jgi:hypothetical protein
VTGAEVIQIHAVDAVEQGQLVADRFGWEKFRARPGEGAHLQHRRPGVLVRHDLGDGWELEVALGVVGVGVRIDDHGDRLVGHRLNRVEDAAR